jgi:tRNA-dihydrouridine synthase
MHTQIKNFKPKNRIFLAPMEKINDIAFRLLCKKCNCGLTYTGLTNPLTPKELILDDKPVLQIFSRDEKGIKKFMKKYESKVSFFDFNLVCPSKLAKKHGFGSYLTNLKTIEKILKTMKSSAKKPITIKIRKSKISFELLELAEKYCDAIAIHARTKEQGYSGEPDLNFALKIKEESKIPVIYSGNVNENNYKNLLEKFDFVMIGRSCMGHPEIFAKLTGKNAKISFKNYLKLALKYKLPFKQIKLQAMCFTKGIRNSRKLRNNLAKCKNVEDILKIYPLDGLNVAKYVLSGWPFFDISFSSLLAILSKSFKLNFSPKTARA